MDFSVGTFPTNIYLFKVNKAIILDVIRMSLTNDLNGFTSKWLFNLAWSKTQFENKRKQNKNSKKQRHQNDAIGFTLFSLLSTFISLLSTFVLFLLLTLSMYLFPGLVIHSREVRRLEVDYSISFNTFHATGLMG